MNTVVQEHWNGDEDMARGHAAINAEMSTEVDAREAWVNAGDALLWSMAAVYSNPSSSIEERAEALNCATRHRSPQPEDYVLVKVANKDVLILAVSEQEIKALIAYHDKNQCNADSVGADSIGSGKRALDLADLLAAAQEGK